MTSYPYPLQTAACIAFEKAFSRIRSNDRVSQRQGLWELLQVMRDDSAATPQETLDYMIAGGRIQTVAKLADLSRSVSIRQLAKSVLEENTAALWKSRGKKYDSVDRIKHKCARRVVNGAFRKLSGRADDQVEGLEALLSLTSSRSLHDVMAVFVHLMEADGIATLQRASGSSLPFISDRAKGVMRNLAKIRPGPRNSPPVRPPQGPY